MMRVYDAIGLKVTYAAGLMKGIKIEVIGAVTYKGGTYYCNGASFPAKDAEVIYGAVSA